MMSSDFIAAATVRPSSMVSIEAREGVTTGISAADRARTIATGGHFATHHAHRFAKKGEAVRAHEVGYAHHLEHREPGAQPLLFHRGSCSQLQIEEDELAA
jgi:3,4-dihydroxy-2-butanone 4-phosphate synthase